MSKLFWTIAATVVFSTVASSQETAIVNPVYRRAQTLVNDGNPTAGRALIDSMVSAATPGSNEYAEAIYWRAVLAGTAADAEMDYRRIVVDYAQSPRVEDALIRLSQLEIARANYDGALRHLNLLVTDHPQSPARARAGYWIARAMFDKNDIQGGCIATADALTRTTEDDAELRNQITYLNQRCAGVSLTPPTAAVPAPPSAVLPVSTGAPVDSVATTPIAPAPVPTKTAVDSAKSNRSVTPTRPPVTDTPAPVKPRPAGPSKTEKPPAVKTPEVKSPPAEAAKSSGAGVWSVQIAAYNVKTQAIAMVAKLKKSGYEARVDGTAAPFRVRIGKYATQSQASAVQRSLTAKKITGFVVQAETQ